MGAYQQVGERLINRGFAAVPIMPGTKRPGFFCAGMWIGLSNWQKRFNNGPPPESERARWAVGDAGRRCHRRPCQPWPDCGSTSTARTPPFRTAVSGRAAVDRRSQDRRARRDAVLLRPRHRAVAELVHQRQVHRRVDRRRPSDGAAADDASGRRTLSLVGIRKPRGSRAARAARAAARHRGSDHGGTEPFGYRPEPALHERRRRRQPAPAAQQRRARRSRRLGAGAGRSTAAVRRARGGYEAVPIWRPSTTGRAPEKRHRNLKIVAGRNPRFRCRPGLHAARPGHGRLRLRSRYRVPVS